MCEITAEGLSAKHGPTLISSIFGRHIAVSFSEMFFFIHSNPVLSARETGQSITPTHRDREAGRQGAVDTKSPPLQATTRLNC